MILAKVKIATPDDEGVFGGLSIILTPGCEDDKTLLGAFLLMCQANIHSVGFDRETGQLVIAAYKPQARSPEQEPHP